MVMIAGVRFVVAVVVAATLALVAVRPPEAKRSMFLVWG